MLRVCGLNGLINFFLNGKNVGLPCLRSGSKSLNGIQLEYNKYL